MALAMILFLAPSARAVTLEVPAQYATVASAVAVAASGDVVRISSGTYKEHGLVLTAGITIEGAGATPAECTIDAGGEGRILSAEFVEGSTHIRNLTFTGGHASGETTYDSSGGALFINSSAVTLETCRFIGNSADYSGGAVRAMGADPVITGCRFESNQAVAGGGALDLSYSASALVTDTSFLANQADYGGALSCRGGSNPRLVDCTFTGNTGAGERAWGGGAITFFYSDPSFERCVFRDNRADLGGALYNHQDAQLHLDHCTLVRNIARMGGGGLFTTEASPVVTSSLVVFQEGEGILSQGQAIPVITCTDIFGNSRGDWVGGIATQLGSRGNLAVDPLFCTLDPSAPPVLQSGSPCTLEGGACDDMGALGSGCYSDTPEDPAPDAPPPYPGLANLGAWPNPFNPRTRIHFELGTDQRVEVDVYGIDGRRVRRLADAVLGAGTHDLVWDGTDDRGRSVASGQYVVVAAGERDTGRLKIILLK
jgi:hypothetical protein